MAYIELNELRRLAKEINNNPILNERLQYGNGERLIRWLDLRENINHDLKETIDKIKQDYPDDWKSGFPPKIIEWYEDEQTRIFVPKGNFIRIPHLVVDGEYMKGLTPTEWMVLTIFARYAYFGDGVREEGRFEIRHGQTFVGAAKVAEMAGMSESHVRKTIASLTEKGHLTVVAKRWNKGCTRTLRMVAFLDETFV